MRIQIRCPNPKCGKTYRTDDRCRVRATVCPACGETITIPDGSDSANGQAILREGAPEEDPSQECARAEPVPSDATLIDEVLAPGGPNAPRTIARFEIRLRLQARSLGQVYQAHDPVLDREVILNVLKAGSFPSENDRQRLLAETKAAARLRHPNIAAVYEAGMEGDTYHIASAHVEGGTLREAMRAERFNFERIVTMIMGLAEALDYAHRQGVVHQSLSPDTILLNEMGNPLIIDFGLARLEAEHKRRAGGQDGSGSPANLAPEQIDDQFGSVGPATDQYALGVVLYELLCGTVPFSPPALLGAMVIGQTSPSPRSIPSRVPADLGAICLKALSTHPSQRYGNCLEMTDDLRRYAAHEPVLARPVGLLGRLARWRRRNPTVALLSATAILLGVFAVAGSVYYGAVAAAEAQVALEQQARAEELLAKAAQARQQEADARRQMEENQRRAAEQRELAEKQVSLAQQRGLEAEQALKSQEEATQKKELAEQQAQLAEEKAIEAAEAAKEATAWQEAEVARQLVSRVGHAKEALKRAQEEEEATKPQVRLARQELLHAQNAESRQKAREKGKAAWEQQIIAKRRRLDAEQVLKNAEQDLKNLTEAADTKELAEQQAQLAEEKAFEAAEAAKEAKARQEAEDARQLANRVGHAREALKRAQEEEKATEPQVRLARQKLLRAQNAGSRQKAIGERQKAIEEGKAAWEQQIIAKRRRLDAEQALKDAEQDLKNLTEAADKKEGILEQAQSTEEQKPETEPSLGNPEDAPDETETSKTGP